MTVQEEISYLANAMTEEQRKSMFLANSGFSSDAQRKAVMAKLHGGEGGGGNAQNGSPYDDASKQQRIADLQDEFDDAIAYLESIGGKHSNGNPWTVERLKAEWVKAGDNIPRLVALVENANGNLYNSHGRLVSGRFAVANRKSVEDEITERALYLANAGFVSDAQRKAVMAKLKPGGPGVYGDTAHFRSEDDVKNEAAEKFGYDVDDPEFQKLWDNAVESHLRDVDGIQQNQRAWMDKYMTHNCQREAVFLGAMDYLDKVLSNRELLLVNKELTDEQRKAIFAKMGGSGGSGGNRLVYTRASSDSGSSKRIAGTTNARTVSTTSNGTSGGGSHYTGAGDRTSSWVTKLSPEQMKEEYKNDPDRLKAAIEEQLHWGAYDGIEVNGHKPSVMDIINGGIAPNYVQEGRTLTDAEVARLQRGSVDGYEARALNPSGQDFDSAPGFSWDEWVGLKEGKKPSWLDVGGGSGSSMGSASSPSDQAKQDVSGGGSSSTSGGASASGTASLPDAIDNLPDAGGSGASDGGAGDGGSSAPNYLQEFLDALSLAHF